MEVCYSALLFMPLVILHHLLNVSVQLAIKRGLKNIYAMEFLIWRYSLVSRQFPTETVIEELGREPNQCS
jgi:hypothetical protein